MKAKRNFSRLVEDSAAKGTMGLCAAIMVFVGVFVVWSISCVGGAVVNLFN